LDEIQMPESYSDVVFEFTKAGRRFLLGDITVKGNSDD
jgi:hypothetical protein